MKRLSSADTLLLHREITGIPSVSKSEAALADFLAARLSAFGVPVERFGRNVFAIAGPADAPILMLNTHIDTVPPSTAWTRAPHMVTVEDGKVFGLGANDAKAAVAAMVTAFVNLMPSLDRLGLRLLLTLVCDEETGGEGTEALMPELARRGLVPTAALIGEPTGLDLAIAQKGLLVLELEASGDVCHAAHGRAKNATNAIHVLAKDLAAIDKTDFGADDRLLGPITCEPTLISGGTAKNMLPATAKVTLDVRTNPSPLPRAIVADLQAKTRSTVKIVSERLRPCGVALDHPIVRAARAARPGAQLIGSRGISDWVFIGQTPAVKVGPGKTERSHQPDEFVYESEVLDGAAFYEATAKHFAEVLGKESTHDAALGSR